MATELQNKTVTCRVAHVCDWCGEQIEVRTIARYHSGIYAGDFYYGHQHPECSAAMQRTEFYDDGYAPYEQERGKSMEEDDGNHT